MATCAACGQHSKPPDDELPLGWMTERDERGLRSVVCPACTRRYSRSIEGKLDRAWW